MDCRIGNSIAYLYCRRLALLWLRYVPHVYGWLPHLRREYIRSGLLECTLPVHTDAENATYRTAGNETNDSGDELPRICNAATPLQCRLPAAPKGGEGRGSVLRPSWRRVKAITLYILVALDWRVHSV